MKPLHAPPAPACRFTSSLALATALLLATPAFAHQYWLAPGSYAPAPGQTVGVVAIAGTGFRGEPKPWSPPGVRRFIARTARTIDLAPGATIGETLWARFRPVDDGGAMLAYESGFAAIQLPAAAFDAYLADEGLTGPLARRRALHAAVPGRERYRRCAKTWLAGGDAARATVPVGLPLEIVPTARPGVAGALNVRVLLDGRPLAGALVKTWRAPLAPGGGPTDGAVRDSIAMAWQGATDARGELAVPCARAGEYLLSVVHMAPCTEPAQADWESTWASLTFERPQSTGAAR